MFFERKLRISIWTLSISIGVLAMLTPFLLGLYVPQMPYLVPLNRRVNNVFASGFIIAFAFPSLVEISNHQWSKQIDRNIPILLRDISEAASSGMTLPRALEEASQRDYGPLSNELRRTVSSFAFGASWSNTLLSFAKRLARPSALRFTTILIESHQTGGRLIEVLNASVELFTSLDEHRKEQITKTRPYIMTLYIATMIFLIISYVVLSQFLAPLCNASSIVLAEESGFLTGVLDIRYYASIFFWASIIESVFSGLIAGKMGEGSLYAGLAHSVILCITTLIFFNIAYSWGSFVW